MQRGRTTFATSPDFETRSRRTCHGDTCGAHSVELLRLCVREPPSERVVSAIFCLFAFLLILALPFRLVLGLRILWLLRLLRRLPDFRWPVVFLQGPADFPGSACGVSSFCGEGCCQRDSAHFELPHRLLATLKFVTQHCD